MHSQVNCNSYQRHNSNIPGHFNVHNYKQMSEDSLCYAHNSRFQLSDLMLLQGFYSKSKSIQLISLCARLTRFRGWRLHVSHSQLHNSTGRYTFSVKNSLWDSQLYFSVLLHDLPLSRKFKFSTIRAIPPSSLASLDTLDTSFSSSQSLLAFNCILLFSELFPLYQY